MEAVDCDQCDLAAVRIFTAPVMVVAKPDLCYDSPIDGTPITSWAARQEDMKRNNCIEYDPEMKKDAARAQQDRQAAFDKSIDQTVAQTVAKMPAKKRAQLKKELVNQGADCRIVR